MQSFLARRRDWLVGLAVVGLLAILIVFVAYYQSLVPFEVVDGSATVDMRFRPKMIVPIAQQSDLILFSSAYPTFPTEKITTDPDTLTLILVGETSGCENISITTTSIRRVAASQLRIQFDLDSPARPRLWDMLPLGGRVCTTMFAYPYQIIRLSRADLPSGPLTFTLHNESGVQIAVAVWQP